MHATVVCASPHAECYLDNEAIVIRVSAQLRGSNTLHLIFHSINTEAAAAVENRSASTILFRKFGDSLLDWQIAHPWTSVPVAWDIIQNEGKKV